MSRCLIAPRLLLAAGCLYLSGFEAAAQSPSQKDFCRARGLTSTCAALAEEFAAQRFANGRENDRLQPFTDTETFVQERVQAAFAGVAVKDLEARYKQLALQAISTRAAVTEVGAPTSSGTGSTNLVSKPTTTDFLSIASESGAFTDTVNGTSVTLQANANGLAKLFSNKEIFALSQPSWSAALQPLNFTVTLNVSQSGTGSSVPTSGNNLPTAALASVLLPANNASLSAFSARYNIYRPTNPLSSTFSASLDKAIAKHQADLDKDNAQLGDLVAKYLTPLRAGDDYQRLRTDWQVQAASAERAKDFNGLLAAYKTFQQGADALLAKVPDIQETLVSMNVALRGLQGVADDVMNEARGTALATITYTYATPSQKPATHQFGVVGGYLFKGGHRDPSTGTTTGRTFSSGVQLNFNFAAALYAEQPTIATNGRLRDLQVSSELDKPFGGTSDDPRATWSVAGYGQYQYDPTVLNITSGNLAPGTNITLPSNAQVLLGTAGWLGVVQGKLVINLSKGLSLPIALKWSNKTDLLDANDIRGQFGISYDLSALGKLIAGGGGANGQ